ncbi:AAA family ATPase [Streptomyces sp. NPDC047061]|uniref:ATP-binding protein n=1 Tax=Streptomyces sp. NPDC047061 TaxID=3154605 RepID=UPI0033FB278B
MGRSTPLRGRSDQLSLGLAVLRRTVWSGQSGIVLVTGEPGMGKSALLDALTCEAAPLGFVIGRSSVDEIARTTPGAPLLMALRSGPLAPAGAGAGEIAELDGLSARPLTFMDRIGEILERAAAATPVLIAVDDVQWADQLSRTALSALPGWLAGHPLVWVFTSRDPDCEVFRDLAARTTPSTPVTVVPLAALGRDDVLQIARDRLGRPPSEPVRRMLDGVGGSPFLAVQLLEGLLRAAARGEPADRVPDEFIAGVRRSLAGLDPAAADVVRMASVLGRTFAVDEMAELLAPRHGHPSVARYDHASVATGVEAALASGLLGTAGHRIGFRHDLVRETVYGALSDGARRRFHRGCAAFLIDGGHSPLEAAPHARLSVTPDDEECVRILRDAAEEAVPALPETAGKLVTEAFRLLRPGSRIWRETGEHCVDVLGRVQRAADAVHLAETLLRRTSEPEATARIQVLMSRALWLTGNLGDSVERIGRVLALPGISPELRARLEAARALALTGHDACAARAVAPAALQQARAVDDREAMVLALQAVGEVGRNSGHHLEAMAAFRELRQLEGVNHVAGEIIELQLLDRYEESEALIAAALADARDEVEAVRPSLLSAHMWHDFNLSRLDDAESGARALICMSQELGGHVYELDAVVVYASVCALRGEWERAKRLVADRESRSTADDGIRKPSLRLMRGWFAAAEGRPADAVDILAPVLYTARESRTCWPWWPGWTRLLLAIGTAAGDERFAKEALTLAEEGAARNPGIASYEGIAYQTQGLARQDLTLLEQAADTLGRSPRPELQAGGAADYGKLLAARGRRAEAAVHFDRAWAIYDRMGARPAQDSLHRAARKAGIRRPEWSAGAGNARPTHGWAALTDAEARVAALISAGHTNRSAAAELGVSPNTVGTHLRSVFTKLDVNSRVQLVNAHRNRTDETFGIR